MAIKKHTEQNGRRSAGYVDTGSSVDDDYAPVATVALVFMVVSLNGNWKLPCGYFLISGMSGVKRANFVHQCLLKLHDVGVCVRTATCDGPSSNFTMMEALGLNLSPPNISSSFPHPADPSVKVHVMLNVSHA